MNEALEQMLLAGAFLTYAKAHAESLSYVHGRAAYEDRRAALGWEVLSWHASQFEIDRLWRLYDRENPDRA